MSISPCGIHDKGSWIFTDGFREGFRTVLYDDVTPSDLAGEGSIETSVGVLSALQYRNNDVGFKPRFTDLSLYGTPINSKISKVCQELLGTVLALNESEEVWGIINESSPCFSSNEDVVG
jgi:hypothetical protein